MAVRTIQGRMTEATDAEQKRKSAKRLEASIDKNGMISLIGELLKRQREHINLSQKQIADKLGLPYFNFISMIENGSSKIPLTRIPDLVKAYGLEPEFIMILTKELHPDTWSVMVAARNECKEFNSGVGTEELEKEIGVIFKNKFKSFRLPTRT